MIPVYYFPYDLSNTISLVSLKLYSGFQKVTSEKPEYCDFVYPQAGIGGQIMQHKTVLNIYRLCLLKSTQIITTNLCLQIYLVS